MSDKNKTNARDRLPIGQKLAVGAGGFPIQNGGLVVQYMAQPIFQIFLGLNPALFGLAMTIPRIWDAFTDPLMGRISVSRAMDAAVLMCSLVRFLWL